MKAFGNLIHFGILGLWALLGLGLTAKLVFGAGPLLASLFTSGTWWLWFAGLAAVTTVAVKKWESAVAPLLVHAGAFLVLAAIPRVFPLNLLRLGLDLLSR